MAINLSVMGQKSKEVEHSYMWKDVVLYNLGLGAKAAELQYVYEGFKGGVKVLPTFWVIPVLEAVRTPAQLQNAWDDFQNPSLRSNNNNNR